MSPDNLLDSLKAAAAQRAIDADQLRTMLDDEVRALSSDARVHDYIHVFAIRHLRERMRSRTNSSATRRPARDATSRTGAAAGIRDADAPPDAGGPLAHGRALARFATRLRIITTTSSKPRNCRIPGELVHCAFALPY